MVFFLGGGGQTAAEVERLTKLKASRMKDLVLKKRLELEEICRWAHIEPDSSTAPEKSIALIDSGNPSSASVVAPTGAPRFIHLLFYCYFRHCGSFGASGEYGGADREGKRGVSEQEGDHGPDWQVGVGV